MGQSSRCLLSQRKGPKRTLVSTLASSRAIGTGP